MATHSSILVWKTLWIEGPGGLWSMGSQSIRHDRTHTHIHTPIHLISAFISEKKVYGLQVTKCTHVCVDMDVWFKILYLFLRMNSDGKI